MGYKKDQRKNKMRLFRNKIKLMVIENSCWKEQIRKREKVNGKNR